MLRIIWTVVLVGLMGLLTACGGQTLGPSNSLIKQAIALQVSQTQAELTRQLRLSPEQLPEFSVRRVAIAEQEPVFIDRLSAFHLRGTYDLFLKLPTHNVTQTANPFDLYLQRQIEGKTWRLAYPRTTETGEIIWETQLVE